MVGVQAVKGGGGRGRKCCWLAVDGRRAMGDDGCETRDARSGQAGGGSRGPLVHSLQLPWRRRACPKRLPLEQGCGREGAGMRQGLGACDWVRVMHFPWRNAAWLLARESNTQVILNYERISLVLVPAKPTATVPPTRACRCCLVVGSCMGKVNNTCPRAIPRLAGWRAGGLADGFVASDVTACLPACLPACLHSPALARPSSPAQPSQHNRPRLRPIMRVSHPPRRHSPRQRLLVPPPSAPLAAGLRGSTCLAALSHA
jgi:hypothetical protein